MRINIKDPVLWVPSHIAVNVQQCCVVQPIVEEKNLGNNNITPNKLPHDAHQLKTNSRNQI